jgi:hypothetical protein
VQVEKAFHDLLVAAAQVQIDNPSAAVVENLNGIDSAPFQSPLHVQGDFAQRAGEQFPRAAKCGANRDVGHGGFL